MPPRSIIFLRIAPVDLTAETMSNGSGPGGIASLFAQLQANIEEINACVRNLNEIKVHDEAMIQLEAERTSYISETAAKELAEDQAIAAQRAAEDETRRRQREKKSQTVHDLLDLKMAKLEEDIAATLNGGHVDLESLLEKRKDINEKIDAEMKRPLNLPTLPIRKRGELKGSLVAGEQSFSRRRSLLQKDNEQDKMPEDVQPTSNEQPAFEAITEQKEVVPLTESCTAVEIEEISEAIIDSPTKENEPAVAIVRTPDIADVEEEAPIVYSGLETTTQNGLEMDGEIMKSNALKRETHEPQHHVQDVEGGDPVYDKEFSNATAHSQPQGEENQSYERSKTPEEDENVSDHLRKPLETMNASDGGVVGDVDDSRSSFEAASNTISEVYDTSEVVDTIGLNHEVHQLSTLPETELERGVERDEVKVHSTLETAANAGPRTKITEASQLEDFVKPNHDLADIAEIKAVSVEEPHQESVEAEDLPLLNPIKAAEVTDESSVVEVQANAESPTAASESETHSPFHDLEEEGVSSSETKEDEAEISAGTSGRVDHPEEIDNVPAMSSDGDKKKEVSTISIIASSNGSEYEETEVKPLTETQWFGNQIDLVENSLDVQKDETIIEMGSDMPASSTQIPGLKDIGEQEISLQNSSIRSHRLSPAASGVSTTDEVPEVLELGENCIHESLQGNTKDENMSLPTEVVQKAPVDEYLSLAATELANEEDLPVIDVRSPDSDPREEVTNTAVEVPNTATNESLKTDHKSQTPESGKIDQTVADSDHVHESQNTATSYEGHVEERHVSVPEILISEPSANEDVQIVHEASLEVEPMFEHEMPPETDEPVHRESDGTYESVNDIDLPQSPGVRDISQAEHNQLLEGAVARDSSDTDQCVMEPDRFDENAEIRNSLGNAGHIPIHDTERGHEASDIESVSRNSHEAENVVENAEGDDKIDAPYVSGEDEKSPVEAEDLHEGSPRSDPFADPDSYSASTDWEVQATVDAHEPTIPMVEGNPDGVLGDIQTDLTDASDNLELADNPKGESGTTSTVEDHGARGLAVENEKPLRTPSVAHHTESDTKEAQDAEYSWESETDHVNMSVMRAQPEYEGPTDAQIAEIEFEMEALSDLRSKQLLQIGTSEESLSSADETSVVGDYQAQSETAELVPEKSVDSPQVAGTSQGVSEIEEDLHVDENPPKYEPAVSREVSAKDLQVDEITSSYELADLHEESAAILHVDKVIAGPKPANSHEESATDDNAPTKEYNNKNQAPNADEKDIDEKSKIDTDSHEVETARGFPNPHVETDSATSLRTENNLPGERSASPPALEDSEKAEELFLSDLKSKESTEEADVELLSRGALQPAEPSIHEEATIEDTAPLPSPDTDHKNVDSSDDHLNAPETILQPKHSDAHPAESSAKSTLDAVEHSGEDLPTAEKEVLEPSTPVATTDSDHGSGMQSEENPKRSESNPVAEEVPETQVGSDLGSDKPEAESSTPDPQHSSEAAIQVLSSYEVSAGTSSLVGFDIKTEQPGTESSISAPQSESEQDSHNSVGAQPRAYEDDETRNPEDDAATVVQPSAIDGLDKMIKSEAPVTGGNAIDVWEDESELFAKKLDKNMRSPCGSESSPVLATRAQATPPLQYPDQKSPAIREPNQYDYDEEEDHELIVKNLDEGHEQSLREIEATYAPNHQRDGSQTSQNSHRSLTQQRLSPRGSLSSYDVVDRPDSRASSKAESTNSKSSRKSFLGSIASLASSVRGATVGKQSQAAGYSPVSDQDTYSRDEENKGLLQNHGDAPDDVPHSLSEPELHNAGQGPLQVRNLDNIEIQSTSLEGSSVPQFQARPATPVKQDYREVSNHPFSATSGTQEPPMSPQGEFHSPFTPQRAQHTRISAHSSPEDFSRPLYHQRDISVSVSADDDSYKDAEEDFEDTEDYEAMIYGMSSQATKGNARASGDDGSESIIQAYQRSPSIHEAQHFVPHHLDVVDEYEERSFPDHDLPTHHNEHDPETPSTTRASSPMETTTPGPVVDSYPEVQIGPSTTAEQDAVSGHQAQLAQHDDFDPYSPKNYPAPPLRAPHSPSFHETSSLSFLQRRSLFEAAASSTIINPDILSPTFNRPPQAVPRSGSPGLRTTELEGEAGGQK